MFGIGGSYSSAHQQSSSKGFSSSSSVQGSQNTSSIAFEDLFQQLFQNAGGAAAGAAAAAPALTGQAAQLFSGGLGFLDQLQDNGAEAAQLDALKSGLGDLFRDEINPTITDAGVASGTLGGGRQGVAQGVAAGKIAQQYQQGAAQIMGNARNANINAAATGLGSLGSLYSLLQNGSDAGLAPYLMLAQIMGGPTVLSQGSSFGNAESSSYDESQSTGSSHSTSFNLGFGG